jgi:hypothetical protein
VVRISLTPGNSDSIDCALCRVQRDPASPAKRNPSELPEA